MVWRTAPCRAVSVAICASLLGVACATSRPGNRFVRTGGAGPIELFERPAPELKLPSTIQIEAAVEKARLQKESVAALPTAEGTNDNLRTALAALGSRPSAGAHVRVAQAYAQLGVHDLAIEHFDGALRLDDRSAAAYDGRARIWRDWYLPSLALGDAYRAVYFAPRSAGARNTLGTIFIALGNCRAARAAFERALELDSGASYAAANLKLVARVHEGLPGPCQARDQGTATRPGSVDMGSEGQKSGAR